MKSIINKQYHIKKFFFMILTLLLSASSIAQDVGPFTQIWTSPPSYQIWKRPDASFKSDGIQMNTTKTFDKSIYNGIQISIGMEVNTLGYLGTNKLVSLRDSKYSKYPLIEIRQINKSILLKRLYNKDSGEYYEYKIFDKMFNDTYIYYTINIYITANFIFIVTYNRSDGFYMSPILFGLNFPDHTSMASFINRSQFSSIEIGSASNPQDMYGAELHVFSYNRQIGKDSNGNPIYEGLLPNIQNWIKQHNR